MAEKKSENKIMAMLERTGVIRKADSVDNPELTGSAGADIKPVFDAPDDPVKVTPAARQPIPGMPSPVFPSDKPSSQVAEQPKEDVNEYQEPESLDLSEDPALMYEPNPFEEDPAVAYEPPVQEAEPPAPAPAPAAPAVPAAKPASSFSAMNIFRNGGTGESAPPPPVVPERVPQPESYTDRYLNTEELYSALALRSKKTESIYLIEEYLNTLPDSLPDSSRREIINKLIDASEFDYDLLMGDGVLRVKMLKEYAERFARHTDDYIAARQAELDELDQQILRTKRLIDNRKDLHKKQFFSIEAEAQRLKEILTFISG